MSDRQPVLKPCPFCGGKAQLYEFMSAGHIIVECTRLKCSGQGPVRATDKSAITAWNRRAPKRARRRA